MSNLPEPSDPVAIQTDQSDNFHCPCCCDPNSQIARQNSIRAMFEALERAKKREETKYFQYRYSLLVLRMPSHFGCTKTSQVKPALAAPPTKAGVNGTPNPKYLTAAVVALPTNKGTPIPS